jgi:glucosamine--fructose-6-phosphate aminotransferase (isomerizing)
MAGEHTLYEITTQGDSWRSAVDAVLSLREQLVTLVTHQPRRSVIFVGCGSTHHLAQFAAPFFQGVTGMVSRAVPSSELLLHSATVVGPGKTPLIVALSRSGETSETVMAVQHMRRRGYEALAISCYDSTPLSAVSSLTVGIPAGREQSFAQTRSFAGMLVAVQALAALVAGDDALLNELKQLPAEADAVIARAMPLAESIGTNEGYRRITYLGSSFLYGLANEATVKVKEMSLSVAEAYHFMEFRHGPMALVDGEHLAVGLLSDAECDYEVAVLRDVRQCGGHIAVVANDERELGNVCEAVFALRTPLSERARAVLYMPFLQLLAYYRSLGRGLNPDRPRHVVMAIKLEGTEML